MRFWASDICIFCCCRDEQNGNLFTAVTDCRIIFVIVHMLNERSVIVQILWRRGAHKELLSLELALILDNVMIE